MDRHNQQHGNSNIGSIKMKTLLREIYEYEEFR